MPMPARSSSRFAERLQTAVFGTYFLGAIVPLVMLAWLGHRYVLPESQGDPLVTARVVGVLVGVAFLTLASFFALRRTVGNTLERIGGQNERLAQLVAAARHLSSCPHAQAVAEGACRFAVALSSATGAALWIRPEKQEDLEVYAVGDEAMARRLEADDGTLAELAREADRGARTATASGGQGLAAVAVPIETAGRGIGVLLAAAGSDGSPGLEPEEVDALGTLATLTAVALENTRLLDSQRNFFAHTTEILAGALDQHVRDREGHATAVARIAHEIGRALELPEAELQRLHYASLLHDIGMLKIPPQRHESAAACRQHAVLGHRLLSRIHLWRDVAPIVLSHHERWDGGGYPEGLSGEQIPLAARIVAVADSADAMRRPRVGREPLTPSQVVEELEGCAATQFDPEIVAIYRRLVDEGRLEG